jgi:hypothetical protein
MPNPAPKTVTEEDAVITESNSVRVLIPYCASDTVYEALILAIALLSTVAATSKRLTTEGDK